MTQVPCGARQLAETGGRAYNLCTADSCRARCPALAVPLLQAAQEVIEAATGHVRGCVQQPGRLLADTAGTTLMRASTQACPPCWAGLAPRVEHALALVLAVSCACLHARRCFWCATGPEGADTGASAAAAEHKHELTPAEREFVRALNSVRGSSALAAVWSTVV